MIRRQAMITNGTGIDGHENPGGTQIRIYISVELLVVVAIIGILAGLLLPTLASAKAKARRTTCLNNLKQINLAVQLYAGANGDTLPSAPNTDDVVTQYIGTNSFMIFYKRLVRDYTGLTGAPSPQDKLFACPADRFYYRWPTPGYVAGRLCESPATDYSSYGFNGLGETTNTPPTLPDQTVLPGVAGWKLAAIKEPVKTILVTDLSTFLPYSVHEPLEIPDGKFGINDAPNVVSFADGHVSYLKIYANADYNLFTFCYDPRAGYDYKWSGD